MAYQLGNVERGVRNPLLRPNERNLDLAHWLRSLVAAHLVLGRLSARRVESTKDLPPHLLRDIGLSHDFRSTDGLAHPQPPV